MPASRSAEERFWEKVKQRGDCWIWTAAKNDDGYGTFWDGTQVVRAHRWAYEYMVGPIPDGLQLDHVKARGCTSRLCCNPAHLEPVTNRVNAARGLAPIVNKQRIAAQTHCKNGHEFTPENTRLGRDRPRRRCRACDRERTAMRRAARKESA